MNDRQKLLIGAAIVIILLLLIGAYALSGSNNNTTATPTPTTTPTPTPTPTPVPSGGTGNGATTPTITPVPTATATPVPTIKPTPAPVATPYTGWPYYDFHWSVAPATTPTPTPASSTVGFNDVWGNVYSGDGAWFNILNYWENDVREVSCSDLDNTVFVKIQLNRSGDLTSSYSVPVIIGDAGTYTDHSEVLGIQYATFDAGQSTANMTVLIDRGFFPWEPSGNVDAMILSIVPSPDYNIISPIYPEYWPWVSDTNEFLLVVSEEAMD